jgi:acyl carrier protein
MTLEEKVEQIIIRNIELEKEEAVSAARIVDDLGADSLDIMGIAWDLEEEFPIGEISDEDMERLDTVRDIIDYVRERL